MTRGQHGGGTSQPGVAVTVTAPARRCASKREEVSPCLAVPAGWTNPVCPIYHTHHASGGV